jgi:hypothetical protein
MVKPPNGVDAGEATAHWVRLAAPSPTNIILEAQGNISADTITPNAHTFYPSLGVSSDGIVAVGYSFSSAQLELSSGLSFLTGPRCGLPLLELAPEFLRRGSAPWGAPGEWGDQSATLVDSGGGGFCFWVHNAHPIMGVIATWASAIGKFCLDPALVFLNGFEGGNPLGWSCP